MDCVTQHNASLNNEELRFPRGTYSTQLLIYLVGKYNKA